MTVHPIPFYSDPWRSEHAAAATAIWDWHLAIVDSLDRGDRSASDYALESNRLRTDFRTDLVEASLMDRVHRAVQDFDLDMEQFAVQLSAAEKLAGRIRFSDFADQRCFAEAWACPVGRLLARLVKRSGVLHVGYVDAMSHAFFMLGCLLDLPRDIEKGRLMIPDSELQAFSVKEDELASGPPGRSAQKLLWKQCVRIRDYFARALPLSRELPRAYSVGFRRWWLGGLEVVNAIERRRYDVWSGPIHLSAYHRAQARFQARFARISFKRK